MAKVIDTNPHIRDELQRAAAVRRFVEQSSAIEGIQINAETILVPNEKKSVKKSDR